MQPAKAEPLLTWEEVAEILRCSPSHIRTITRRGDLPCIKIGRSIRYMRADVDAFIEQQRTQGRNAA